MSFKAQAWRRGAPVSNAPSKSTAPYGVEQNGKLVYDCKSDIRKLAMKLGAKRIFDRVRDRWLPFDPDTGKILGGTVAQP